MPDRRWPRLLPRLVGATITHLDWAPVDSESDEKALQLSVDTPDGTHIAVAILADLDVIEKGEW